MNQVVLAHDLVHVLALVNARGLEMARKGRGARVIHLAREDNRVRYKKASRPQGTLSLKSMSTTRDRAACWIRPVSQLQAIIHMPQTKVVNFFCARSPVSLSTCWAQLTYVPSL